MRISSHAQGCCSNSLPDISTNAKGVEDQNTPFSEPFGNTCPKEEEKKFCPTSAPSPLLLSRASDNYDAPMRTHTHISRISLNTIHRRLREHLRMHALAPLFLTLEAPASRFSFAFAMLSSSSSLSLNTRWEWWAQVHPFSPERGAWWGRQYRPAESSSLSRLAHSSKYLMGGRLYGCTKVGRVGRCLPCRLFWTLLLAAVRDLEIGPAVCRCERPASGKSDDLVAFNETVITTIGSDLVEKLL